MLTLVKIEAIHPRKYVATLDRDGKLLSYEFDIRLPGDARIGGASEPLKMYADLIDYEDQRDFGPSRGMLYVPAIDVVRRLVFDVAVGDKVDLPIVLDER